ncbi:MAG: hypothetical protein ABSA39_18135 [Edaphobacter sp.]
MKWTESQRLAMMRCACRVDVGFSESETFGGAIHTPTLDALAKRGLLYNRFHTTAMCSPALPAGRSI